jgi:hypothetical protein
LQNIGGRDTRRKGKRNALYIHTFTPVAFMLPNRGKRILRKKVGEVLNVNI